MYISVVSVCEFAEWAPAGATPLVPPSAREEAAKKIIGASKRITGQGVKAPACGCYECNGQATSLLFLFGMPLKKIENARFVTELISTHGCGLQPWAPF